MTKRKQMLIREERTLDDLTSISKTIMPLAKQQKKQQRTEELK